MPSAFQPMAPPMPPGSSNLIRDMEMQLIDHKKEKVVEIMKGSTVIHELIAATSKPDKEGISLCFDLNSMLHSLFNDKHFVNSKLLI